MEVTKKKRILRAIELVDYYHKLDEQSTRNGNSDFLWKLGLFLAKQFLRILEADSPNIHELRILVKVLEQDFAVFGSGWCDLYWQAKHFLDLIESKPENGWRDSGNVKDKF